MRWVILEDSEQRFFVNSKPPSTRCIMVLGESQQLLSSKPTKRNGFIDAFKGGLILWVLHIHTVFWTGMGYIPEDVRQKSLLIDVGAFFFISGYLTKPVDLVSALRKSARQFTNLYTNYLSFSCLLLLPLGLVFILKDKAFPNWQLAIISMLRVNPIGELWQDVPIYVGSLWYIATYLSLLVFVPFLVSIFSSRPLRVFTLVFIIVLFSLASNFNWSHDFLFTKDIYIYFYLFIYMLGVAYRVDEQNISVGFLKLTFIINVGLCLVIFFFLNNGVLKLHDAKFPPSFQYLAYSLLLIHIFAIVKHLWKYPDADRKSQRLQVLEWCGQNVYFIYLLQGVVCSVPGYFIPTLVAQIPTLGVYFICLAFNIGFTLLLTLAYVRGREVFLNFVKTVTARASVK